ncbi:MAG TPA: cyclase family protein [Pyrinomonadaceae bacterium]|nr:cyclase family protein [Pyrinomonadaceae bacterium]HMP65310.1 cyclase family protein [Pyrinomonadaceae bacterium]
MIFDLSIPLRFGGPQPNAWDVERAVAEPVRTGSLVGDTRQGGSVNFERYTFIPHCNGTHTECVGHITNRRIAVRDCLQDILIPAILISVEPQSEPPAPLLPEEGWPQAGVVGAAGGPFSGDQVISANLLRPILSKTTKRHEALIIRTLPNTHAKLTAEYGESNIPPYFTADAMQLIVEHGFTHLLVDMPSIDRIFDDGKLTNHRIFWNVEEGSFETNPETRINSTITELIFVPNDVPDGEYMLNLQIAPFDSDCAPSRPLLLSEPVA